VSLLPFFEWMANLPVTPILANEYVTAAFNLVHLLSMVVFFGAILMVDLRLLGRGLTQQPLAQVARSAQPWLIGGLTGLILTGIPAVLVSALTQYDNSLFWFKMYVLAGGLVFAFTVRRMITRADEARVSRFWAGAVGLASIALWATVAATARMIMLY
jgi:hypothetical protein